MRLIGLIFGQRTGETLDACLRNQFFPPQLVRRGYSIVPKLEYDWRALIVVAPVAKFSART